MSAVLETGRISWPRAIWTLNEVTDPRQVAFEGDGVTFVVRNEMGTDIATLTIGPDANGLHTVERLDARTFRLTGEDGTEWIVSKKGCNCGGGG